MCSQGVKGYLSDGQNKSALTYNNVFHNNEKEHEDNLQAVTEDIDLL